MRSRKCLALAASVLVAVGVLLVAAAPRGAPPPPQNGLRVLEISLGGTVAEQRGVSLPFGPASALLRDYTATIRKAAQDPKIRAIAVRLKNPDIALAQVQELAEALKEFQATQRPVYCYVELCTNRDYALACQADRVCIAPGGTVALVGLSMEVAYLKGLFDWAGIHFDVIYVGIHKIAGEPFTRTDMSKDNRKVLNEFLDDVYGQFVGQIAQGRKKTPEQVRKLIDDGPYTAAQAQAAGLVDQVAYYDQFLSRIGKDLGGKVVRVKRYHHLGKKGLDPSQLNLFSLLASLRPQPDIPAGTRPKVVIIYATGQIVPSAVPPLFGNVITHAPIAKAFASARKDPTVKAIVLRIDSPGGSALVSDLIWREVVRTRTGKRQLPVVASMGDVAASGGYYIAMAADEIVAQPTTITGSIGVVGLRPNLKELYKKIRINVVRLQRGKNAGLLSLTNPLTDSERRRLDDLIKTTYKDFVAKAAQGRGMKLADMVKLATGRVWTAREARKLGLVDRLGGLKAAYDRAVELAGLKGQDVQPVILPRERSLLEVLFESAGQSRAAAPARLATALLPGPLSRLLPHASVLRALTREPVHALVPYTIDIR